MTVSSCLTFVVIVFSCYALNMSKPIRNETAKKVDLPHEQQQQQHHHHQLQSEANYETRQKRSQLEFGSSSAGDLNDVIEDLGDNNILPVSQEMEMENMPPLVYFMLLQKIKQLQNNERQLTTRRTPRLGRSIDFQLFDGGAMGSPSAGRDFDGELNMASDYALPRQFLPRVMKKSVQFKPRLGKRTQVCN